MSTIRIKSASLFPLSLLALAIFVYIVGVAFAQPSSPRSQEAISQWTPKLEADLKEVGLKLGSPVFFRITKTTQPEDRQGYLEAFVQSESIKFEFFKKWAICTYSGDLGPKLKEGDGQSPEGFYFVKSTSLNPNSSYHLSFNIGFPNRYDRAHNRTGSFLMVHGDCVSIGCYAMTDEGIEEIYTLMDAAFQNGQPFVRVHIFPFVMTDQNMLSVSDNQHYDFWENLKQGWDHFEKKQYPPNAEVVNKQYVFD